MSQPDFWDHQEKAQETITELKSIKSIVEDFDILSLDLSDEIELLEMCDEVEDQAHIVEVKKKISTYRGRVNKIELKEIIIRSPSPRKGNTVCNNHDGHIKTSPFLG